MAHLGLQKCQKLPQDGTPKRPQIDEKFMSKNNQIFDRIKSECPATFEPARRNALASWGDYRGGLKTRFLRFAGVYGILKLYDVQILEFDLARSAPPLRGGRPI